MRKLYSAYTQCIAGCKYCFAKWDGVYSEQPLFDVETLSEKEAIVYPCCDGEFFDQSNYTDIAKSFMDKMDKLYFSISTKRHFEPKMLERLVELNDLLTSQHKGFVKFSISISNRDRIGEIEPGTLSYNDRIVVAKEIVQSGLPCSLTLKPILPFIQTQEYCHIIDDFSAIFNRVLLGGLYVCPQSEFYLKYIKGKYSTVKREVQWLSSKPTWDYVVDPERMKQLKKYAIEKNMLPFDSDIDVVKSFI